MRTTYRTSFVASVNTRTFPVSVSSRRRNPSRVVNVPALFSVAVVFLRGDAAANACPATGAAHKLTGGVAGDVVDSGNGLCRGAWAAGAFPRVEMPSTAAGCACGAVASTGGWLGVAG